MSSTYAPRLQAFRNELRQRQLDGFIVPLTDEHMSEYVGAYAHRLAWLTGFKGSAGSAVVLRDQAAIFVDGRYTVQVRAEVSAEQWSYESLPQTSVAEWLNEHAGEGARIGYDAWLHTKGNVADLRAALARKKAQLVAVDSNPVDTVWSGKPLPSVDKMVVYPDAVAGQTSSDKRKAIAQTLTKQGADAVVLCALDSIAWVFNIRGTDVAYTPVMLAFALVQADGSADLFVDPKKVTDEAKRHLGPAVRLHPREAFAQHLASLNGKTISVDPERAVAAIFELLEKAGAKIVQARDPAVLPKAIKNSVEINGHRAAQARDGAALSAFLHWISVEAPKGQLDEMRAADKVQEFREKTGKLRDLSFSTISAAGPSAALPHYRSSEETNRPIKVDEIYLIDSGGQYLDGTTDVTRTLIVGKPTAEMKDRFTRVLKGHIAIATAVFPVGTRGFQIDMLSRQFLWEVGLDYGHGTGHGVGAYLAVHEGPQRIANTPRADEPLVAGMILSNEPGYYKPGDYGIRIENLILVVERDIPGAERKMLGFETLTFAPFDRELIDVSMLNAQERKWLNGYHAEVARIVGPQLDGAAKAWLIEVTRPLS